MTDSFEVSVRPEFGKKLKKFKKRLEIIVPNEETGITLNINPPAASISNKNESVHFVVTARLAIPEQVKTFVIVSIDGLHRHLLINLIPEITFFSNPLNFYEMTIDMGHNVPIFLAKIREMMAETGALAIRGVFSTEVPKEILKNAIENIGIGAYEKILINSDSSILPNLIKAFLRSTPKSVINEVPNDVSEVKSLEGLMNYISEGYQDIFLWIMDLLAITLTLKMENFVTSVTLVRLMSPILYRSETIDLEKSLGIEKILILVLETKASEM